MSKNYVDRIRNERNILIINIEKLEAFIDKCATDKTNCDTYQLALLREQARYMRGYASILHERLYYEQKLSKNKKELDSQTPS